MKLIKLVANAPQHGAFAGEVLGFDDDTAIALVDKGKGIYVKGEDAEPSTPVDPGVEAGEPALKDVAGGLVGPQDPDGEREPDGDPLQPDVVGRQLQPEVPMGPAEEEPVNYRPVHKGRGVWAIVDDEGNEVETGLTKEEAYRASGHLVETD